MRSTENYEIFGESNKLPDIASQKAICDKVRNGQARSVTVWDDAIIVPKNIIVKTIIEL